VLLCLPLRGKFDFFCAGERESWRDGVLLLLCLPLREKFDFFCVGERESWRDGVLLCLPLRGSLALTTGRGDVLFCAARPVPCVFFLRQVRR